VLLNREPVEQIVQLFVVPVQPRHGRVQPMQVALMGSWYRPLGHYDTH
jgi:hypothetical protein